MIYILAPFNLSINTTSRNRILSFYLAIKRAEYEVRVLNPPILPRDTEFNSKGIQNADDIGRDLVPLEPVDTIKERLVSLFVPDANHRTAAAVLNLLSILYKGCDFYYSADSLKRYFTSTALTSEDILIASGFPFSLFSESSHLSRQFKCKLILDYRDPWTYGYTSLDSRPLSYQLKSFLQRKTENKCLERADQAFCDTETVKNLFPSRYRHKVDVILNGANLQAIEEEKIISHPSKFRIAYLGTVYNDQLAEDTFFVALGNLIKRNHISKEELEVIFIGSLGNQKLEQMLRKHQLEPFVRITPRLPLSKAIEMAYSASVFLHLRYGTRTEVDSSKHLDYLALQKPILLPISDNGNAARSIQEHNAGYVCQSYDECYSALRELWKKHKRAENFKIPRSKEFLYSISREHEADKLIKVIQSFTEIGE